MNRLFNINRYLLSGVMSVLTLSLLLLAGCSKEEPQSNIGGETTSATDGASLMTICIESPSKDSKLPSTYSLTPTQENSVEELDVLVFKNDGGGNYSYMYRVQGTNITNWSVNGDLKRFKVQLKWCQDPSEKLLLVVLANSRSMIPSLPLGASKADVLKLIKFSSGTEWPARLGGSSVYTPFPMWGEIDNIYIDRNTPEDYFTGNVSMRIKMLRALARIDVGLKYSGNTAQGLQKTFMMEEVYVFNSKQEGYVAPIGAAAGFDGVKVYAPSIPPGNINNTTKLGYSDVSADHYSLESQIYIAEAEGVAPAQWAEATALVVGGRYSDNPLVENTSKVTYYRVNIVDSNDDFRDILRNHCYRINITSVVGEGWNTPEEAFTARNEGMTAEILAWDVGQMDDVVDELYVLRSDTKIILPYLAAVRNPVEIYTDHPDGWKAEPAMNYSWITIRNNTGNPNMWDIMEVDVEQNATAMDRVAEIKITAGRMSKIVKIYQQGAMSTDIDQWTDGEAVDAEGRHYSLLIDKHSVSLPRGTPNGAFTQWALGDINYIYYESFASMNLILDVVTVKTDYYKGFEYDIAEPLVPNHPNNFRFGSKFIILEESAKDWLYVGICHGHKNELQLVFYADVYEGTAMNDIRSAEVYITVGNITKTITVKQDLSYHLIPKGYEYKKNGVNNVISNSLMFASSNLKPTNNNWYGIMNIPSNYMGTDIDAAQLSPAVEFSCGRLNELNYLGFTNWRVPTYKELESMFEYASTYRGLLSQKYMLFDSRYVSSETIFQDNTRYVYFYEKTAQNYDTSSSKIAYTNYMLQDITRCVRNAPEFDTP